MSPGQKMRCQDCNAVVATGLRAEKCARPQKEPKQRAVVTVPLPGHQQCPWKLFVPLSVTSRLSYPTQGLDPQHPRCSSAQLQNVFGPDLVLPRGTRHIQGICRSSACGCTKRNLPGAVNGACWRKVWGQEQKSVPGVEVTTVPWLWSRLCLHRFGGRDGIRES